MAILFDLDQTLIDTQQVEPLRRARRWAEIYPLIPQLQPYEGINELLAELHTRGIPLCIVTSSPRPYCEQVIRHCRWQFNATVCFHDTAKRKPHPDPILEGLRRLGVTSDQAVAVGDAAKDTFAARAAQVISIGALWGTDNQQELLDSRPDVICHTVTELRDILLEKFFG